AISADGLRSYLSFGAVSEPLTAIEGVFSLPAAHTATFSEARLSVQRYWSPPEGQTKISRDDAPRELRSRLEDSVRRHLISDVPLGVFLSGGLDSSALAALAARDRARVRTVSVAFDDPAFSEAPHMECVARHIGSAHTCVTLTPGDLLAAHDGAFG